MFRSDIIAGQRLDADPLISDLAAFLADHLALARIERFEKIVERPETLVVPMKLLTLAPDKAHLAKLVPLVFRREGDVQR